MGGSGAPGAHFPQFDFEAATGALPGGFGSGEACADDLNFHSVKDNSLARFSGLRAEGALRGRR